MTTRRCWRGAKPRALRPLYNVCIAAFLALAHGLHVPLCRRPLVRQRGTALLLASCWNPPCRADIPPRWRKLHDCDRPAKWRELLDDEDCRVFLRHRDSFAEGPGAAVAIAERVAVEEAEATATEIAANAQTREVSRKYTELVPTLTTMDDFVAVNARAARENRLIVVKFYSKGCRACLRIAAKYRRLALDLKDDVDCYEAELSASQSLLERLDVTAVPSVQIFDGDDITRLAMYTCKPAEWKRVDAKVRIAMVSMQKRRGLHKLFGEPLLDILTVPIMGGG